MGSVQSLGGAWYDVCGTDECDYALGEVRTGLDGFINLTYYNSTGHTIRSLVGRFEQEGSKITGNVIGMGRFTLKLLSPIDMLAVIAIVGTEDANNYRIYIRKPYVRRAEKNLILNACSAGSISSSSLKIDPILPQLNLNINEGNIVWPI